MASQGIEHDLTIWMVDEVPARMYYAGRRWRVTDRPTRLRESVWSAALEEHGPGLYGWRFQATDDQGSSVVFDVYRGASQWHVHRSYT
jgi:hypothetical protein